jgi:transposase
LSLWRSNAAETTRSEVLALSLYAALDVKTGKVEGKTVKRHTSAEFIAFLIQLLSKTRWAKEIHIVLDNLSAHKTKKR